VNNESRAVRRDLRFVNEKLNAWDFIGVADEVDDEYECLAGPLTRMLRGHSDTASMIEFVTSEIRDHFEMDESVTSTEIADFVAMLEADWTTHQA
jgi:hypothetical protein